VRNSENETHHRGRTESRICPDDRTRHLGTAGNQSFVQTEKPHEREVIKKRTLVLRKRWDAVLHQGNDQKKCYEHCDGNHLNARRNAAECIRSEDIDEKALK